MSGCKYIMHVRFVGWCCPYCGQWQSTEFRYRHKLEYLPKLKKVTLKCVYCNRSRKLKKENSFGLECSATIFSDNRSCRDFVLSSKNNGKNDARFVNFGNFYKEKGNI